VCGTIKAVSSKVCYQLFEYVDVQYFLRFLSEPILYLFHPHFIDLHVTIILKSKCPWSLIDKPSVGIVG